MKRPSTILLFTALLMFGCAPRATPELIDKGRELVSKVCVRCHSLSVVREHNDTRAGWYKVTTRMRGYGAQFSDEEQDAITAYLAETQPKK